MPKCLSAYGLRRVSRAFSTSYEAHPKVSLVSVRNARYFGVTCDPAAEPCNNSRGFGTSLEQNPLFCGCFSVPSRSKGNRIISISGAGDGNRTHVRSLGSYHFDGEGT